MSAMMLYGMPIAFAMLLPASLAMPTQLGAGDHPPAGNQCLEQFSHGLSVIPLFVLMGHRLPGWRSERLYTAAYNG